MPNFPDDEEVDPGLELRRTKTDRRQLQEAEIRTLHQNGDLELAARKSFELYGNEIMGWLVRRCGSKQTATELFSNFSLYFWKLFDGFLWNSSLRTWMYAITHKVCNGNLGRRHDPLSQVPEDLSALVVDSQARLSTYKYPAVEDAYHRLCKRVLNETEQDMLTWRINMGMKWIDIAQILADEPITDSQELKKTAAALRKQFERIKLKLRYAAEQEGLVRGDASS